MYKWQKVRVMSRKGESIKGISRQMKLSKNTVRKYLRSETPPCFHARRYERVLDSYKELIEGMLKKGYIGTRIYNELKGVGYEGSLSTVHRYISGMRREARIKEAATTRVETPPGKQFQYDWKQWELPIEGRPVRVYIHEVVLSYSRKKYYCSSLNITTVDVIRAIAGAIEYFGGVAEEIVIDNPRQMVITHSKGGVVRYNDEFLRFCGLYGIEPNPCRNYRARTKGKVERPFYYIQEHLLRGLEVDEMSRFDELLHEFTEKYNERPHSDLKESPAERFRREESALRAIPRVEPALLYKKEIRRVSNDGYISWDGALYPVAMKNCLKQVMIESLFGKKLKVYSIDGEPIAELGIRLTDKRIRPTHPEHEQINEGYRKKKEAYRSESVRRFIETFKGQGEVFIEGLRKAVTANMYRHIEEILRYTDFYSIDDISIALRECIEIGAYHKNSVRRLLESIPPKERPMETINSLYITSSITITRPLSEYRVAEKEVSI